MVQRVDGDWRNRKIILRRAAEGEKIINRQTCMRDLQKQAEEGFCRTCSKIQHGFRDVRSTMKNATEHSKEYRDRTSVSKE